VKLSKYQEALVTVINEGAIRLLTDGAPFPGNRTRRACWPGLNPYPDAVQPPNPTAGQRGRSPEHAAARVLPVSFAASHVSSVSVLDQGQPNRIGLTGCGIS